MLLNAISTYWNSRAEGYSLSINEQLQGEVGRYYLELFKKLQLKQNGMNCLDIGCGPGFFSILLSKEGHHVTSMDCSEEMLEKAKENLSVRGYQPHVIRGDAQNLPFENHSFDFIVSRNLVWNLENPKQAYREWYRVLKP